VDVVLKGIPEEGAVLELGPYPLDYALIGPDIYSILYHKRPLVGGYATVTPKAMNRYLFNPDEGFTPRRISELRKFGARYWVIHLDQWPEDDPFYPRGELDGLKRIAVLDGGKTLVYEDPHPKVTINRPQSK
jgi:hypothetical protein